MNTICKTVLLVYVGRSGSTFLANKLISSSPDVLVFPETKVLEKLCSVSKREYQGMSVEQRIELVQSDPRWVNLEIPDVELERICDNNLDQYAFFEALVAYKAEHLPKAPKCVIVKNGSTIWHFEKILDIFSNVSLLHVVRDPRGNVASRMKKIPVYKEKTGARTNDPWFLASHWSKYISRVQFLKKKYGVDVLELSYEKIIENSDREIDRILNWLKVSRGEGSTGVYKLNEIEETMKHSNVKGPALVSRLDAWKNEMNSVDGIVVEYLTSKHLTEPYFTHSVSANRRIRIIVTSYIKHWAYNLKRLIEKVYS